MGGYNLKYIRFYWEEGEKVEQNAKIVFHFVKGFCRRLKCQLFQVEIHSKILFLLRFCIFNRLRFISSLNFTTIVLLFSTVNISDISTAVLTSMC